MKPTLRHARLTLLEMNPVAAKAALLVEVAGHGDGLAGWVARAEVFEVGVDGEKPESPAAVSNSAHLHCSDGESTAAELIMRIGTPFLNGPDMQPRYAAIVSLEKNGSVGTQGEIQFGFDSGGAIFVTEEFREIAPVVRARNPQLPSLFVVSDSTAYSNGNNQRGWGDEMARFFDATKLNIRNRARPGRSTRSFRSEGLWDRVLAEMKPGDVVLLQFGHNDADKLDEGRCRGVLPGVGEETQTVTMPGGAVETVHTYGWYLRELIEDIQSRGAQPVLLSLTAKNLWCDGKLLRHQSDYGQWASEVAASAGVPFIDLTETIADRYDALGWQAVQPLFCSERDDVHTSLPGATLNAECVVAGLRSLPELGIANLLKS